MTTTAWIAMGLYVLMLAMSIGFTLFALRWIRALANVDLGISQEMRMMIHDLKSRDPQLEETLEVALLRLDDWDRKMRRVRLVSFATMLREKP